MLVSEESPAVAVGNNPTGTKKAVDANMERAATTVTGAKAANPFMPLNRYMIATEYYASPHPRL
jgi:hypothetical protein